MKHRSLNILFITCFTWLAISATSSLHAFAASVKNAGMGLTGAAHAQDALTAAYNPANATAICDRADLGLFWDHYSGKAINSGSPVPTANGSFNGTTKRDFYSPDFGINKSFCFCNYQFAVGIVAYNRDFLKTRYDRPIVLLGTTRPGVEIIREQISPYVAVKFDPNSWCDLGCFAGQHSLGLSVNVIGQRIKVDGLENFIRTSIDPSFVTGNEYSYSYGCSPTIGWRGEWCDWLALGVAYTPKTHMARFKKYRGFLADRGRLDVPERVLTGIAINYFPCSTLAFDVEFIGWDRIRALANPFPATGPLGTSTGAGFGWRNQTIYRVGLDYQVLDCLTLRAGYRYGKSFIKSSQVAANVLTLETVEQYVTAGATYQWNCFEFSLSYAHGFKHKISGPIPAILGGGNVTLQEVRDVVGFSVGYNY